MNNSRDGRDILVTQDDAHVSIDRTMLLSPSLSVDYRERIPSIGPVRQQEPPSGFLDSAAELFMYSTHVLNFFDQLEIKSHRQLAQWNTNSLLGLRGFGRLGLGEIQEVFAGYGVRMYGDMQANRMLQLIPTALDLPVEAILPPAVWEIFQTQNLKTFAELLPLSRDVVAGLPGIKPQFVEPILALIKERVDHLGERSVLAAA